MAVAPCCVWLFRTAYAVPQQRPPPPATPRQLTDTPSPPHVPRTPHRHTTPHHRPVPRSRRLSTVHATACPHRTPAHLAGCTPATGGLQGGNQHHEHHSTPAPPTSGDPRTRLEHRRTQPRTPRSATAATASCPPSAAALSVRGETLTCTAGKGDQPPALHPLVQDFLDTLTSSQRERFTGRCPEAILLSRHLTAAEDGRSKRAPRKPLTNGEARRALKHAKITARHIREDGDPLHGSYARPAAPARAPRPLRRTPRRPHRTGASDHRREAARAHHHARPHRTYPPSRTAPPPPASPSPSTPPSAKPAGNPAAGTSSRPRNWADALRAHASPAGHRHTVFPAAVEAWAEFGGLHITATGTRPPDRPPTVHIDPLSGLHLARTLGDLGRALDTEVAPLGEEGRRSRPSSPSTAKAASTAIDHTGDWYLGADIDHALETLITGAQPARLTSG